MSDPETIRVYDTQATRYAELTDGHNAEDPRLNAFIARIPGGGTVLDLGCGPGISAAKMAQAGLRVEALDASAEMVALAGRHPGVRARQAAFDDISGHEIYDGVWANFSLLHAPLKDFPRHLSALSKAMKPGGVFFIGMKLGTGEGPDRLGRHYTYYTQDALEAHLAEAGFAVIDRVFGRGTGLDGSESDWISISAGLTENA